MELAWIESAPLWLIALVAAVLLIVAHEGGRRLALRRRRGGDEDQHGYAVTSTLGLLGLLMAFTFGAAQDRYRLRQDLMVAEANAIGTTYLRFQLADDPVRARLSGLFQDYVRLRVRAPYLHDAAAVEDNRRRTAALQGAVWSGVRELVRGETVAAINLAVVNGANEAFDMADARRAAQEARVPVTILRVLLLATIAATGILGYAEGGRRRGVLAYGTILMLSVGFVLILDLDRPTTGSVTIDQAPMERALAAIEASERMKAAQAN